MYSHRPLRRPEASSGGKGGYNMGCGSRVRVAVPVAAAGGGGAGPRAGPSCSRLRLPMNESARLHPLDADCTLPKDALYLDALWAPLGTLGTPLVHP